MRHWLCGLIVLIAFSLAGCGSSPEKPPNVTAVMPLDLPDFPEVTAHDEGLIVDKDSAIDVWQFIVSCQANTEIAVALRQAYIEAEKTFTHCRNHAQRQEEQRRKERFWRWIERGAWLGLGLLLIL